MACTDEAHDALWHAFHRTRGDEVTVKIADLANVATCYGKKLPNTVAIRKTRTTVTLRRALMFELLKNHAAHHDVKGQDDDYINS